MYTNSYLYVYLLDNCCLDNKVLTIMVILMKALLRNTLHIATTERPGSTIGIIAI